MKIGIYMAYGPAVVLGKEGLGRYIGNLIKGFADAGHDVTIACPRWSLDTIDDLFQDFQIDPQKIEFIVSSKTPAVWRLYQKRYMKRYPKRNWKVKAYTKLSDFAVELASWLISITSLAGLLLVGVLLFLISVACLPLLILGTVILLAVKIAKKLLRKGQFSVRSFVSKGISFVLAYSSGKKKNVHNFLAERLNRTVAEELVKKANQSRKQDVWFVPAIFWPEVNQIDGLKVICAPDLVTREYPLLFSGEPSFISSTEKCSNTIEHGNYFVTYCDFLKKHLLVDSFGKKASHVVAIPHINNSMANYIQVDTKLNTSLCTDKDFTTAFSKTQLCCAQAHCTLTDERYIGTLNLTDTDYIFYASQVRPHKNMLTLVKAYEYLLRKNKISAKLILTGNICSDWSSENLKKYIEEHRLEYDILSLPNVSAQELAALYRCATLVVNPTFYEGGFPFTFGEGMSVGTPSVMSDIPQTREVVEQYGLEDIMLFDPYDWKSMAIKVEYGLKNRDSLYQVELPMYRDFEKRTGEVVAAEYIKAFEYFIELDKEEEHDQKESTSYLNNEFVS